MNRLVEEIWADARTASRQRRVLAVSSVGLAIVTAAIAGITHPVALALVIGFSVSAAIRPGTNAALAVVVVILARWLVVAPEVSSVTVLPLTVGLIAYHLVVAFLAITPHSVVVESSVLQRWAVLGLVVAASAGITWAMTEVLAERDAAGSTVLTAASLLVVAAAAGLLRSRSSNVEH